MAKSRHEYREGRKNETRLKSLGKVHKTRPASPSDRAVIVSFGAVFAAIPWVFAGIAHEHSGHAHMPLLMSIMFSLIGLLCIVGGLARDLQITTVHDE